MQKVIIIVKSACILLLVILLAGSGCAVKKDPFQSKKKSSHVNTSQLGRNKYYFSVGYQKKLQKSVKR